MNTLTGTKVIITAGPTIEPIDPVRFLSNRSSGKQGYAIAAELAARGANVRLVSGPVNLPCPEGAIRLDVESARDMRAAVEAELPSDIFVAVAAVADWRPAKIQPRKAEKSAHGTTLQLIENPDILKTVVNHAQRPGLVIGFAAETHDVKARARAKRLRKGCDWIIANDVSGDVMGGDENAAHLIREADEQYWPRASKTEIARHLADAIDAALASR